MTDDELAQLLPSGLQAVFTNRIAWAKSHLKAAGLIESPRRGYYKISQRGLDVLKSNPFRVDLRLLNQFPEYVEFGTPKDEIGEPKPETVPHAVSETDKWIPEDHLEYGYQRIRQQLATELLAKIKDSSPAFSKSSLSNFWSQWVTAAHGKMPVARSVEQAMAELTA